MVFVLLVIGMFVAVTLIGTVRKQLLPVVVIDSLGTELRTGIAINPAIMTKARKVKAYFEVIFMVSILLQHHL